MHCQTGPAFLCVIIRAACVYIYVRTREHGGFYNNYLLSHTINNDHRLAVDSVLVVAAED